MAEDRTTDQPLFWGVWTESLEQPELCASEAEAIKRAYEIAKSYVGTTVHLMKFTSAGSVKYPLTPTVSGILARNQPRDR